MQTFLAVFEPIAQLDSLAEPVFVRSFLIVHLLDIAVISHLPVGQLLSAMLQPPLAAALIIIFSSSCQSINQSQKDLNTKHFMWLPSVHVAILCAKKACTACSVLTQTCVCLVTPGSPRNAAKGQATAQNTARNNAGTILS